MKGIMPMRNEMHLIPNSNVLALDVEIRAAIANAPSREARHKGSRDTDLPIHLYLEEAIKELDDGQFDFLKPGGGVIRSQKSEREQDFPTSDL